MAIKKAKVETNKAERIREYKRQRPEAMPVEIVAALKKEGIATDAAYVSTILHVDKRRMAKRTHTIPTEALIETKLLINEMGGEDEVRELVKRIERIGGLPAVLEAIDLIARITQ